MSLSVISGGTLLARQDAAAQPADTLKLANAPHLILWAVKPGKSADFEALWTSLDAQFAKSERPEVKEFASTITNKFKLNAATAADQPVMYVFQVDKPSATQSYNPARIIYEFLYQLDKASGKESGIPRAEADELYKKLGSMQDMFASINVWPLTKMGS
jgi:hypothetical protein